MWKPLENSGSTNCLGNGFCWVLGGKVDRNERTASGLCLPAGVLFLIYFPPNYPV